MVEDAKRNYFLKVRKVLANRETCSKTYWLLKTYDSLYWHLVSCELLNPTQSGFRPGDSTINQLISVKHTILKAFDCNPPLDIRSVYTHIPKALDRVWHDGLIYKLKRCGISGRLLSCSKFSKRSKTAYRSECAVLYMGRNFYWRSPGLYLGSSIFSCI